MVFGEVNQVAHVIIHRMFSLPVSLPVRGADGLAKRALYGGVERQRLSSQSIKAHLRNATGLHGSMADLAKELDTELSVRSALIGPRMIATELAARGLPEDRANAWSDAVMALFQSGKEKAPPKTKTAKKNKKAKADDEVEVDEVNGDDAEKATPSTAGRQVLTLGQKEIAALVAVAEALHSAKIEPSKMRELLEKTTKRKECPKQVQDALAALDAMRSHAGLDGALFGRMATGVALSRVDSAVHVGHALTTHPIQSTVDFFSAQDQLLDREAGEAGGAHIGSRELTTGIFYLPVVIDVNQVQNNFAGWTNKEIAKVVGWLVKTVATFTPAAMLGSTAPFPDPGEVIVEITNGQPVNAMGAFEKPVAPTLEASIAAFDRHMQRVWSMIGGPASVMCLSDYIDPKTTKPAVESLAEAVARAVETGTPYSK
jgi:CRISPR system Cascade subunit CasC